MSDEPLTRPWCVAVWPGMGQVAVSAGYYLVAKLEMHLRAEFSAEDLFDAEYVDVHDGVVHPGRLPRSRFFEWRDPSGLRDLVVFIGEAQPQHGKHAFCRRLVRYGRELGV
ncbi:MAG: PAC2 family protein, partial [Planctomycetales bacterium]|nr:PAC2 family protein [Planctomycetales bacterium]